MMWSSIVPLTLNHLPVVITEACGLKTEELKHRSLATQGGYGKVFMAAIFNIVELVDILSKPGSSPCTRAAIKRI
jgi:hypothetical protein